VTEVAISVPKLSIKINTHIKLRLFYMMQHDLKVQHIFLGDDDFVCLNTQK